MVFRNGNSYKITLNFVGNRIDGMYDWMAQTGYPFSWAPNVPTFANAVRNNNAKTVVGIGYVIDNDDGLMTYYVNQGNHINIPETLSATLYVPKLKVEVANKVNTLMDTNIVILMTYPHNLPTTNYHFQIRRAINASSWHTLHKDSKNFNFTHRIAGRFKVRASVRVRGFEFVSEEEDLVVQFPLWNVIMNNPALKNICENLWQLTVGATTTTHRREFGCFITLDTATGEIGNLNVIAGLNVLNNEGGEVDLGSRPNDVFANSSLTGTAVYVVAWAHTHHTPTLYTTFPATYRYVGPSTDDFLYAKRTDVTLPGFAYDYIEIIHTHRPDRTIPCGLHIDADKMIYPIFEPNRRPIE